METIAEIIKLYRIIVIDSLFMSLLFIKLFSYFFAKDAYPVSKEIISWLILICAGASILNWIIYVVITDSSALTGRATGHYWWSFWILIFFSCILPFILLFKKIRTKGRTIFIVALLMNMGWMMERFIIIISNLHRDYLPSEWLIYSLFTPLVTSITYSAIQATIITFISISVLKLKKTFADTIDIT